MNDFFRTGARCGHLEGKGRADQYHLGEEYGLSLDAADAQEIYSLEEKRHFADGYRYGYKLAAEGSELTFPEVMEVVWNEP